MRIAIATAGRFHVLDLARELAALGHEVRFYSYVPRKRAMAFGLPPECHVNLFPYLAPLAFWQLRASRIAPELCERLTWAVLNRAVMATLEPCDVFIFMSGIYLEAAEFARARFGAKLVLVRGSKHILTQDEILAAVPGATRPSQRAIEREIAGYELADRIEIPSTHVRDSFARDATASAKTMLNPYGTDLSRFPLFLSRRPVTPPTFVFAGIWCLRKGCDLLVAAVKALPMIKLHHVGGVGDFPFPHGDSQFVHTPRVDQALLPEIYGASDAFVLASREEGQATVLAQALASGLPIVCTTDTGGDGLRHTPALADRICIVPSGDVDALTKGLQVVSRRLAGSGYPSLSEADRATLSWRAFAERCERNIAALCKG